MVMRYIGGKEGGLDKLKGKTIGFIFLESPYGREPLPLLQDFAKDYGFTVKEYSVAGKEMQDQSAQWLAVRRDRPAWMIMWGWGSSRRRCRRSTNPAAGLRPPASARASRGR